MATNKSGDRVVYLATSGFRYITELEGFDIISLRGARLVESNNVEKKGMPEIGINYYVKTSKKLQVNHTRKMNHLNDYAKDIIKLLDKEFSEWPDFFVDSCTLVTQQKIPLYNDRLLIRLDSEAATDPIMAQQHDLLPYNEEARRNRKAGSKKVLMRVSFVLPYMQYVTRTPKYYTPIISMDSQWRIAGKSEIMPDAPTASAIRKLLGDSPAAFTGTLVLGTENKYSLGGVE